MIVFHGLLFVCLLREVRAQITSKGPCPPVEAMKDFDVKQLDLAFMCGNLSDIDTVTASEGFQSLSSSWTHQIMNRMTRISFNRKSRNLMFSSYRIATNFLEFLGIWYEMQRYYKPINNNTIKCVSYDWKTDDNGTIIQLATIMNTRDCIKIIKPGIVTIPDPTNPGILKQRYSWHRTESNITILATDYASYALAYNCINRKKKRQHRESAWLLTREQKPADAVITIVEQVIKTYNLSRPNFTKIIHDDCEVKPQKTK